jgi:hypothetical protein
MSHFISGQNLATKGDVKGPYQVGTLGAGFDGCSGSCRKMAGRRPGGAQQQCCLAVVSAHHRARPAARLIRRCWVSPVP